jgi:hypothetical protein
VQGKPDTDIGKAISTSPTPASKYQKRGVFFEEKIMQTEQRQKIPILQN